MEQGLIMRDAPPVDDESIETSTSPGENYSLHDYYHFMWKVFIKYV
jgi:hypothetical protein